MSRSPRGQHNGFCYTVEWWACTRVAWKHRSWAARNGLFENAEFARDLLPAAVASVKTFDTALGSDLKGHVYQACEWEAWHILAKLETRKKYREQCALPARPHVARADSEIEERETIQLAMAAMNQRDREIITAVLSGTELRAIAVRHGVSFQRIAQLRDRAIRTSREALRREAVRIGSTLDECWR